MPPFSSCELKILIPLRPKTRWSQEVDATLAEMSLQEPQLLRAVDAR
jgi:hypothetical protein